MKNEMTVTDVLRALLEKREQWIAAERIAKNSAKYRNLASAYGSMAYAMDNVIAELNKRFTDAEMGKAFDAMMEEIRDELAGKE